MTALGYALFDTPIGRFPAEGMAEGAAAVVCVRPQGVRLVPRGFCLPGRVVARRFLGEVDDLQIAVDGLDKPLTARFAQPGSVREGEDVGLDISTDEVLVFPSGDT